MKKRLRNIVVAIIVLFCLVVAALYHVATSAPPQAVPVLNYHQINDRDNNALTVHTDQFEKQMQYLHDNGYTTITPAEMMDAWQNGTPLPDKPVIITFDDGYVDNYKNAYPILQKYNLRATIFLISDYLGVYPNYLTWSEASDMQESGLIDFESHTLSHMELSEEKAGSKAEIKKQLVDSKAAIEWHLRKNVNFIAYPCGTYDEEVEQMTRDAGYRAAFTVNYGLAEPSYNPFILDRVPIFGCNSHTYARFVARLKYAPLIAPLERYRADLVKGGHTILARFIPNP